MSGLIEISSLSPKIVREILEREKSKKIAQTVKRKSVNVIYPSSGESEVTP
jgi:hypothetical protein